jgi:hypothetical protein
MGREVQFGRIGLDCTGQDLEDCHGDRAEIIKSHIDNFINSNSVYNADVVVWYLPHDRRSRP